MIFRSIVDIVIQLQSFRNINLHRQGLYFIKVNIKGAQPYAYNFNKNNNFLYQPFIEQKTSSFNSKLFTIKYQQQQLDLNDLCHFRIEYQIGNNQNTDLIIKFMLYFFDQKYFLKNNLDQLPQFQYINLNSKLLEQKNYLFKLVTQQIHQSLIVLFEGFHFCNLNCLIHSVILDFRFRKNLIQLSQFVLFSQIQRKNYLQSKNFQKNITKVSLYQSLIKSLKLNKNPRQNLKTIYQHIIIKLRNQYKNLYDLIKNFQNIFEKNFNCSKLQIEKGSQNSQEIVQFLIRKYNTKNIQNITYYLIKQQSQKVSLQLFQLYMNFIQIHFDQIKQLFHYYIKNQNISKADIWNQLYIQDYKNNDNKQTVFQQRKLIAKQKRKLLTQIPMSLTKGIYDESIFIKQSYPSIMFYEKNNDKIFEKKQINGIHLIVLVHGYQGTSSDLQTIKNYILFKIPNAIVFLSSSNQENTTGDIFKMGHNLAKQIKKYISKQKKQSFKKLSFIGHSLGGLIIRAALPQLKQFRNLMFTFVTFSTPHLGLAQSSVIIDTGIWFLQKLNHSLSIAQLQFEDNPVKEQTALYRLAFVQGLQYFGNIILLSAINDNYGPYYSSRMQLKENERFENDFLRKIVNQLNRKIQKVNVIKIQVIIIYRTFDSFIGRTAHIMMLDDKWISSIFIQKLCYAFY